MTRPRGPNETIQAWGRRRRRLPAKHAKKREKEPASRRRSILAGSQTACENRLLDQAAVRTTITATETKGTRPSPFAVYLPLDVDKEQIAYMRGPTHRFVETNGICMHVAEQGDGPLVLLCHGFPELWYSWRHQLSALAAAGFRAVAPDMRGYGQSDRPEEIDQYTLLHLVGDMVGLLDALGHETAVIAGHDWGAPVAWHAALLRPDRFRAVIGLSVPFVPRGPDYPSKSFPDTDDTVFYQSYFQAPGVAEVDLEHDVRFTVRAFLYYASGDAPHLRSMRSRATFSWYPGKAA
jgi:alpha/beta hydrolase fold